MIWTMKPTAKKLEDVETKVGNVGNTDLQSQINTLNGKMLRYTDVTVPTSDLPITIGANGYVSISKYRPSGPAPIFVCVANFGGTTGAFDMDCLGSYLFGAPDTVISSLLVLRYFYLG